MIKNFIGNIFSIKTFSNRKILKIFGIKLKHKIHINKYLKKYTKFIPELVKKELSEISTTECHNHSEYVWTMWLKGDIPPIVQMCLSTIKKFYPNAIIITEENMENYISIPKYILEKYKTGIIEAPHFSDYVRCCLLDKYGGLWIDATCYMTQKVPKFITKQDFFILKHPNFKMVSNFFIYSTSNNYFIKILRIFLEQYWVRENIAIDYLFLHKFIMLIIEEDKKSLESWNNIIPWFNNGIKIPYSFDERNIPFDADLWEYLQQTNFMYKIQRKNMEAYKNPNSWINYFVNLAKKEVIKKEENNINS